MAASGSEEAVRSAYCVATAYGKLCPGPCQVPETKIPGEAALVVVAYNMRCFLLELSSTRQIVLGLSQSITCS